MQPELLLGDAPPSLGFSRSSEVSFSSSTAAPPSDPQQIPSAAASQTSGLPWDLPSTPPGSTPGKASLQQPLSLSSGSPGPPLGILGLLLTPSLEGTQGSAGETPVHNPRHQQQLSDALDQLLLPLPSTISTPSGVSAVPEGNLPHPLEGSLGGGAAPQLDVEEAQMLPGSTVDLLLDAASQLSTQQQQFHASDPQHPPLTAGFDSDRPDSSSSSSQTASSAASVDPPSVAASSSAPDPNLHYQPSTVIDILSLERELVKEVIGP